MPNSDKEDVNNINIEDDNNPDLNSYIEQLIQSLSVFNDDLMIPGDTPNQPDSNSSQMPVTNESEQKPEHQITQPINTNNPDDYLNPDYLNCLTELPIEDVYLQNPASSSFLLDGIPASSEFESNEIESNEFVTIEEDEYQINTTPKIIPGDPLPSLKENILLQLKIFLHHGGNITYKDDHTTVLPEDYYRIYKKNKSFYIDDEYDEHGIKKIKQRRIINSEPCKLNDFYVDTETNEPVHKNNVFMYKKKWYATTTQKQVITYSSFQSRYRLVYAEGELAGMKIPHEAQLTQENNIFYFKNQRVIPSHTYKKYQADNKLVYADGDKKGEPVPDDVEIRLDELKKGRKYIINPDDGEQTVITKNAYKFREREGHLVFADTGKKIEKTDIIGRPRNRRAYDKQRDKLVRAISQNSYQRKKKRKQLDHHHDLPEEDSKKRKSEVSPRHYSPSFFFQPPSNQSESDDNESANELSKKT